MKKLLSTLSTIHAVLEDAEQKQLKDKAMQNWLKELNDAAYEADDILDECAFEALRCVSEGQGSSSASLKRKLLSYLPTTYAFSNILFRHSIGNRIKEITDKFDVIVANRSKFHLNERHVVEKRVEYDVSRETSSFITQPQLYGRDEDRDKIVKFLVEDVCDSEDVSVYPILGIGGLGNTTLAQMAFNDQRVKHHFDLKIWVYVSQDFDVKRVIKATIESANGNACKAVDLDTLQRKLRDMLNGKRYLIVLDDVWDEDPDKWDALKYSLKESEIWNLPQDKNSILPALRLSYFYLPLELRQCFAYCAIFPKGSAILKEELIHLWMANGYISCKGGWEPEDIGDQICNELCLISFFQEVKNYSFRIYFKMHDLVHDLVQ
ncbi:hypothetical protein ACSBR2_037358 [Camellia fascicularis]